jgi:hypothetical protein
MQTHLPVVIVAASDDAIPKRIPLLSKDDFEKWIDPVDHKVKPC